MRKMMPGLVEMFPRVMRRNDTLLLLPVYDAGGTADRSVNSETLAAALVASGVTCHVAPTLDAAHDALRREATENNAGVLLVLGARDPGLPRLAARLAGCLS